MYGNMYIYIYVQKHICIYHYYYHHCQYYTTLVHTYTPSYGIREVVLNPPVPPPRSVKPRLEREEALKDEPLVEDHSSHMSH